MGKIDYFKNGNKYIPVVRWKRAERLAIQDLDEGLKSNLMPLIEFIPEDFLDIEKNDILPEIKSKCSELSEFWGPRSFLIDFGLFSEPVFNKAGIRIEEAFVQNAAALSLNPVLIVNPGFSDKTLAIYKSIFSKTRFQCGIRIPKSWMLLPNLGSILETLLAKIGVHPKAVDLILDFQVWEHNQYGIQLVLQNMPKASEWRSLTVLCGAFPTDLTQFKVGQHELNRSDFHFWRTQFEHSSRPNFGDYTIQFPIYRKPPGRANFSASIRYTSSDYWVIMRGESVFKDGGPGFAQWPANAQLLCERTEFCGTEYSAGDKYIRDLSSYSNGTGNAGTWLRATINHHLTFVARQLANLNDI